MRTKDAKSQLLGCIDQVDCEYGLGTNIVDLGGIDGPRTCRWALDKLIEGDTNTEFYMIWENRQNYKRKIFKVVVLEVNEIPEMPARTPGWYDQEEGTGRE